VCGALHVWAVQGFGAMNALALRVEPLGSARALLFGALAEPLGSALAARAYFLLLRQKKVAKEKATPGSAPAARVPCATRFERGLRNSGFALRQSSPSFRSNLRCSAPLRGTQKASRNDGFALEKGKISFFSGRPLKTTQNHLYRFGGDAFRVPLGGAEQRRLAGGFGLRLSEPQASLASRPASRVAQGTGQRPAPTRGSPSSLATFFLAKQEESTPARKAEPPRKTSTTSSVSETPRKGGTPT